MKTLKFSLFNLSVSLLTLFVLFANFNIVDAATNDSSGAEGFFAIFFICGFYGFIIACALIINLFFAWVVYKDAIRNNVENPLIWALLTFIFNVMGLLVYYLGIKPDAVRAQEKQSAKVE